MSIDLFGEVPAIAAKPVHGKHYCEPRGYAMPPGSGPAGETCGTCQNLTRAQYTAGRYYKCALAKSLWTHGRKTDVLVHSPACAKWLAKTERSGRG